VRKSNEGPVVSPTTGPFACCDRPAQVRNSTARHTNCTFHNFLYVMRPGRAVVRRPPRFLRRSCPAGEPHGFLPPRLPVATHDVCPRGSDDATRRPTATPRPCLRQRERPQTPVKRPDARRPSTHLLLTRTDDVFQVAKRDLHTKPPSDRLKVVRQGRRRVGAEERHPTIRIVDQDDPGGSAGRSPRGHERLEPLDRCLAVERERDGPPTAGEECSDEQSGESGCGPGVECGRDGGKPGMRWRWRVAWPAPAGVTYVWSHDGRDRTGRRCTVSGQPLRYRKLRKVQAIPVRM
jgi:hypothetical protein